MSEWSAAVSDFRQLVGEMRGVAAQMRGGAAPASGSRGSAYNNVTNRRRNDVPAGWLPNVGGNDGGAQLIGRTSDALAAGAQSAGRYASAWDKVTNSLLNSSRAGSSFLNGFVNQRLNTMGFNLVQNALQGVVNETIRIGQSSVAFQQWRQQAGLATSTAHDWDTLSQSIDANRSSIEALVGSPSMDQVGKLQQGLNNLLTDPGTVQTASGLGNVFGRIANSITLAVTASEKQTGEWAKQLGIAKEIAFVQSHIPTVTGPGATNNAQTVAEAQMWARSLQDSQWQAAQLQQQIKNLDSEAQSVKNRYDDQLTALQKQQDTLSRITSLESARRNLNKSQADLMSDMALAVDVYSQAGQNANRNLLSDLAQFQDAQANLNQLTQRYSLQDVESRVSAARDSALADIDRRKAAATADLALRNQGTSAEAQAFSAAKQMRDYLQGAVSSIPEANPAHHLAPAPVYNNPPIRPNTAYSGTPPYTGLPESARRPLTPWAMPTRDTGGPVAPGKSYWIGGQPELLTMGSMAGHVSTMDQFLQRATQQRQERQPAADFYQVPASGNDWSRVAAPAAGGAAPAAGPRGAAPGGASHHYIHISGDGGKSTTLDIVSDLSHADAANFIEQVARGLARHLGGS